MALIEVDGFLADSVVRAEGKLYVQGAGWNRITASLFPAVHDRIGIGLIFRVQAEPSPRTYRFDLRLEDAEGAEQPLGMAPPGSGAGEGRLYRLNGEFTVGPVPVGDESLVAMAVNLNGMSFERPAAYRFAVSVDGTDVKVLPFRVEAMAAQSPPVTGGGGYL
ncbi:MAG: hypothetical protein ACE14W_08925 [Candidatus Velamenicoccus archaeovorus]